MTRSTGKQLPDYETYKRVFGETGTDRWVIEILPDGAGAEVRIPTGHVLEFQPSEISPALWTTVFTTEHASNRLWQRSLWYCVLLAEQGQYALVEALLQSFIDFLGQAEKDPRRIGMNSMDHCCALNLRTAARLTLLPGAPASLKQLARELSESVIQLIANGVEFLENNHGVMMALGVLHARAICHIRDDFAVRDSVAIEFLHRTFDNAVDKSGFVQENSSSYQAMWIGWAEEVAETFSLLDIDEDESSKFLALRDNIALAFRHFVVSEDSIVACGDSNSQVRSGRLPQDGHYASSNLGFMLHNDGAGGVVMFTCGCQSPVHKHADDTALQVWFEGHQLIADAGFHNYDNSNPVTRCVTSQRGHSGLFFKQFDAIPGPHLYPWNDKNARIRAALVDSSSSGSIDAIGFALLEGVYRTERRIHGDPHAELRVDDRAHAPAGEEGPVARFLIPAEFIWSEVSQRFESDEIFLQFESDGVSTRSWGDVAAVESLGMEDEPVANLPGGLVCRRPGAPEPCTVLEIELLQSAPGTYESVTVIRFGRKKAKVFVFGSCVSLDTFELASGDAFELLGSVARQSIISAFHPSARDGVDVSRLTSAFQRTMVEGDLDSNLLHEMRAKAPQADLIIWDLMDERNGVVRERLGGYVTPLAENREASGNSNPPGAEVVEFGTPEHLMLFREHARRFRAALTSMGVWSRFVVFDAPLALDITPGDPTIDLSLAEEQRVWGERMAEGLNACYQILREEGFTLLGMTTETPLMIGNHRWGQAPFHYADDFYREAARRWAQAVSDYAAQPNGPTG